MAPRHLLASVTLLLAVSLVGCSDDSPDAEPDPSDTPTSVSPTDEETEAEEKLGPVQTVRAWVEAYNHLTETGDVAKARALSTDDCRDCENLFEPILETHENGGRFDDPGWEVIDAKRAPEWSEKREVATAIRFHKGRVWKSEDAEPVTYPQEDNIMLFRLGRDGDAWLVSAIVFH